MSKPLVLSRRLCLWHTASASPYCLRQYGLWNRPSSPGWAHYGLWLRYCPLGGNTLRFGGYVLVSLRAYAAISWGCAHTSPFSWGCALRAYPRLCSCALSGRSFILLTKLKNHSPSLCFLCVNANSLNVMSCNHL